MRDRIARAAALPALALALAACGGPERPPPVVVAAVDGADWSVVRSLWEDGRLPHLKALAERGATAKLRSGYGSKSVVVWTSIATGVVAERHGITDFVLPTAAGDVPAASTARKVPAIWNMLDASGRRAAVLGFWATWPAEATRGLVVSDRALSTIDARVWPPERAGEVDALAERLHATANPFPSNSRAALDRLMARLAVEVADERFDLVIFYLKSVDHISHEYWKYYRPGRLGPVDPDDRERYGDLVPAAYEAVDGAIGAVVEAYGPAARYVVLSDHGFYGLRREKVRVSIDLDRLFEALGFLELSDDGVDMARTRLFTYSTPYSSERKKVRCALAGRDPGGTVLPGECARLRSRLERELDQVRWSDGEAGFTVEDAAGPATQGADFVVIVRSTVPAPPLRIRGTPVDGVVGEVNRISGSHGGGTPGIFLAAGPGIAPGTSLGVVDLHDVTPTLLYALGLPVAEDFDGRARTELFDARFGERHPLTRIASWGERRAAEAPASEVDAELLDELRALGYLD